MAKRKELGFHKPSGQYRKIYQGTTYYLGPGKGLLDGPDFNRALYRWEKIKEALEQNDDPAAVRLHQRYLRQQRRCNVRLGELHEKMMLLSKVMDQCRAKPNDPRHKATLAAILEKEMPRRKRSSPSTAQVQH